MFCMSEHSLDQRNEERLAHCLPVTSAGQTGKQRNGAEQGAQRFTLFPPLVQDRNSKIYPTTVKSRANKNIYRNSANCTIKLHFFPLPSLANFTREIEMSMAIWCNKSQEERKSVFRRSREIFYKVQFQSLRWGYGVCSQHITFLFPREKKSSLHISACQEICILRREPNMAECNRLKIPSKNLYTMWRAGFFLLNTACVPKRKEEHRVIGVW